MVFRHRLVIQILFRSLCNLSHHPQCFHRVLTHGGLAGKHNGIRTFTDGIGNVCHLCPCGPRVTDHGIQHLSGNDNRFIFPIALIHDHLLYVGHFIGRYFHTHIPPGHHDPVSGIDDLVDILDAFPIFDLRDHIHMLCAVFLQNTLDLLDSLRIPHKRCGNKINPLLNSEDNIFTVFWGNPRKVYSYIGDIDPLALSQLPAVFNRAGYIIFPDFFYLQCDQAVIDQDSISRFYILCQLGIRLADHLLIPDDLPGCEDKLSTFLQLHFLSVLQDPCADLRPFRIQQNSYGLFHFLPDAFQQVKALFLLFMVSMGKIKPGNIHSVFHQCFQHLTVVCIWSHGTNNLCSFHKLFLRITSLVFFKFNLVSGHPQDISDLFQRHL